MLRRFSVAIAGLAVCCCIAGAAVQQQSLQTPLLKETVSNVRLNISVHDRHGNPVANLSPADFRILDDGAPVHIEAFRAITAKGRPAAGPRLVSLVFESFDTGVADVIYKAAGHILKSDPPDVYFSVWQIDQQLRILRPFTRDRGELEDTLHQELFGRSRHKKRSKKAASQEASDASIAGISHGALDRWGQIERERHGDPWATGLQALIEEQAPIPGRKEVFLFSEGVRGTANAESQLRAIISHANRAGVTIYTVDTSGLSYRARQEAALMMAIGQADRTSKMTTIVTPTPTVPGDAIDALSMGPLRSPEFDRVADRGFSDREGTLRLLARATGGQYIDISNFHDGIRSAAEDLSNFYDITYKPKPEPFDGHFRALSVKVDRPRLKVQNRAGYFATATVGAFELAPFEVPLAKALASPPEKGRHAVLFDTHVFRFGKQTGKLHAALAVQFSLSELRAQENRNERLLHLHFAILVLIRTADGRILQKFSEDVPEELAIERRGQLADDTFTFERPLLLAAGRYEAEIAIADDVGHTIDKNSVPFSLAEAHGGLVLSDLVLVKTVDAAVGIGQERDPLRYGNERVVPELSPVLTAAPGATAPLFLTIYPDAKSKAAPQLEFEIIRDGKALAQIPVAMNRSAAERPSSYLAALKEDAMPSGRYVIIAQARQGSEKCEQRLEFTLIGSQAAQGAQPRELTFRAAGGRARLEEPAPAKNLLPAPALITGAQAPSEAELQALLERARRRAVAYRAELPNFVCLEVIRRFTGQSGRRNWKSKDTVTALVHFQGGAENYQTLQVDGQRTRATLASLGGVRTRGEFGEILGAVFSQKADAAFQWAGETEIHGLRTEVLKFSVARAHSLYTLATEDGTRNYTTAFHGYAYLDANTYNVRGISIQAEGLPKDFPYRDAVISVSYDYIAIGGQEYSLPVTAKLLIRAGRHSLLKNEMEFIDYRRFAASSKLVFR